MLIKDMRSQNIRIPDNGGHRRFKLVREIGNESRPVFKLLLKLGNHCIKTFAQ